MNSRKVFSGIGAAVAVFGLLVSSSTQSYAAVVPDYKAKAGDECRKAGITAKGRGVEGTDLTCTLMTYGSYKDSLRW